MPHSQGLSNNPNPEPNKFLALIPISLRSSQIFSSLLCLGLPSDPFPTGLPVKIEVSLLKGVSWLITDGLTGNLKIFLHFSNITPGISTFKYLDSAPMGSFQLE